MLALDRARRPPAAPFIFLAALTAVAIVAAVVVTRVPDTNALFTNQQPVGADLAAARIFEDERVTPAFSVSDHSAGSAVDGSSASAFGNDGRYFLTRTWATAFASNRYLDLDFNGPLPVGLTSHNAAAAIRLSSDAGTGIVCVYAELRRASTDGLLSSHGSAGSPLACTSGTQVSAFNVALGAVSTTDLANDLRLRLFARDSAGGAVRLDEASIGGQTPHASWVLYPILTREQYAGQLELLRWGLAGP